MACPCGDPGCVALRDPRLPVELAERINRAGVHGDPARLGRLRELAREYLAGLGHEMEDP